MQHVSCAGDVTMATLQYTMQQRLLWCVALHTDLAAHVGSVDEHIQIVLWQVGGPAVPRVIQICLECILVGQHSVMPAAQPDKGVGGHVQQVPHAMLPRPLPCQSVC